MPEKNMSINQWRPGILSALSLPTKMVHVWRLYMDQPDSTVATWRKSLSAEERERGDRFYFERDRRRFVISRAAVKHLLSVYSGVPVKDIVFHKGPYGKPYLTAELGDGELQFNVSHSHETLR